jgi:hypothetical protein
MLFGGGTVKRVVAVLLLFWCNSAYRHLMTDGAVLLLVGAGTNSLVK